MIKFKSTYLIILLLNISNWAAEEVGHSATKTPYILTPETIALNKVFKNDTTTFSSTLYWQGLNPKKLTFVPNKNSAYVLNSKVDALGKNIILTTSIQSGDTNKDFIDTVTFKTEESDWPLLRIPVSGTVVNSIEALDTILQFGEISVKKKNQKKFRLYNNRVGKYDITKVVSKPNMLYVALSKPRNGDWVVYTTIYPGERTGPFKGIIKLFVNNSKTPEIVIPVRGVIVK